MPFHDREDAACRLAAALSRYRGARPLVLGIPRGGVAIGRIVAAALEGELDVVLVRKLRAPDNSEFAIGSVDENGRVLLDEVAARWSGTGHAYVQLEAARQLRLIGERRLAWRGGRARIPLAGRTVIVIDDGLTNGSIMAAALRLVRAAAPARLVCAVPVAAHESLQQVRRLADEVVCLAAPWPCGALGLYYEDVDQVEDADVAVALAAGRAEPGRSAARRLDPGQYRARQG
ncbi:phosphoribosyltransferase [Luteimonas sp. SJ-92]|uniref:Phosphoribosyltransferase n=1 Tax=Luteimonas salinisoli TaxID=2752307 RepID=A0A853JEV9_9GAMM|nr:phosphoribosyltransferase [Luteimonas salinisoli]